MQGAATSLESRFKQITNPFVFLLFYLSRPFLSAHQTVVSAQNSKHLVRGVFLAMILTTADTNSEIMHARFPLGSRIFCIYENFSVRNDLHELFSEYKKQCAQCMNVFSDLYIRVRKC